MHSGTVAYFCMLSDTRIVSPDARGSLFHCTNAMHAHGCQGDVFPFSQLCTLTMCGCRAPPLGTPLGTPPLSLSRARGPHRLKFTTALVLDHPNVRWCRGGLRDPPTTLTQLSEVTPARTPSRGPPLFNSKPCMHACTSGIVSKPLSPLPSP